MRYVSDSHSGTANRPVLRFRRALCGAKARRSVERGSGEQIGAQFWQPQKCMTEIIRKMLNLDCCRACSSCNCGEYSDGIRLRHSTHATRTRSLRRELSCAIHQRYHHHYHTYPTALPRITFHHHLRYQRGPTGLAILDLTSETKRERTKSSIDFAHTTCIVKGTHHRYPRKRCDKMKSILAIAAVALAAASSASAQTAGVPATINGKRRLSPYTTVSPFLLTLSPPFLLRCTVGNGQTTATFPTGLGGSSTGTPAQFTPGAADSSSASPYYVATNSAESATLASLLTHYSQGISASTPTTGPPTGISTGVPGGFTGSNTVSILDGSISTIPNAATTYTGPYASIYETSSGSSNGARREVNVRGGVVGSVAAVALAVVGGAAWIL